MVKNLKGINAVAFARKLSKAATEEAHLIPWQTSLSFDPSRDSDSTATKDGAVNTQSSVETDLETEFINNTSAIADAFYDSLFDGDKIEFWIVHKDRLNDDGQAYAWYMQTSVSEDSNDNDADDNSTRHVSFAVDGTPKRGWTDFSAEQQADIDYVFRGIGKYAKETNGDGAAWDKNTDAGKSADETTTPTP
ncbi:hypothetical protein LFYK43_11060 [Ligilactobacillus salitolerans]|uniref:Phage tail protein n=1 Tax=Ligilactobacillus salitolerans TaxID=1808352 RepID=A0A401IT14_9LACO|nr:phage major tail protein, TP901-1 family [Ligilactobacillus salitolerans]GBG94647.1 hypothetical protein LFYK43_11060 [Ligilactobacillus salitolerans]